MGAKATVTEQLEPAARVAPHVVESTRKSVPKGPTGGGSTHAATVLVSLSVAIPVANWPMRVVGNVGVDRLTWGATPWIAVARGAPPDPIVMLSMLFGTVRCAVLVLVWQMSQLSPDVLSGKYSFVVTALADWASVPKAVPLVVTVVLMSEPHALTVRAATTVGNAIPPKSQLDDVEELLYGR
jgi:hypothetical protein